MTTETKIPEYEGWAVVELMGHRRLAGYVREAAAFGTSLLRVDVPGDDPAIAFATQYYGGGSIYALTPCTEEIARSLSKHTRETPAAIAYALPEPKKCDVAWDYRTPCSPDTTPNIDPAAGTEAGTICGRHRLERDADATRGAAIREKEARVRELYGLASLSDDERAELERLESEIAEDVNDEPFVQDDRD
jgi:hypothetical protein